MKKVLIYCLLVLFVFVCSACKNESPTVTEEEITNNIQIVETSTEATTSIEATTEPHIMITKEEYLKQFETQENSVVEYSISLSKEYDYKGKTVSVYEVAGLGDGCVLSVFVPVGGKYISDILLTIEESNNMVSMAQYHVYNAIEALGIQSLDPESIRDSLGVTTDRESRQSMKIANENGIGFVYESNGTRRDFSISFTNSTETSGTETVTTLGQENALKTALSYLNTMAFSKSGLFKQLKYEGYTDEEANYGVEHCNADWKQQAEKMAQYYLDLMAFSRSGLIDQLVSEGFSQEEAEYGVSAVGY